MKRGFLTLRIAWALWRLIWHRSIVTYHQDAERRLQALLADLCGRRQRLRRAA